jgi:hypothetical protein
MGCMAGVSGRQVMGSRRQVNHCDVDEGDRSRAARRSAGDIAMAQKYGTEFSHLRTADWFVRLSKE